MKSTHQACAPVTKKQKGMTLIELIVVVVVVGILAVISVKSFSNAGVTDSSKAQALFEASAKLSQNAVLLAQAAGTSPVAEGSSMPKTGSKLIDVLINGPTVFDDTKYPNAYATSGITPLTSLAQGSAGNYRIAGYALTMGGGDNAPHTFEFAEVPNGVTQVLVSKYGSNTPTLAADGDQDNPVIKYSAETSSGVRTVTILRSL